MVSFRQPRISVAMCTYNGSRYLEGQLDSIAKQQLAVSELIVCDDGSSDGTMEILKSFSKRAPFPVIVSRNQVTLGSSKNFEKAIRLCSGDLVALADQDDLWFPGKTATLVTELHKASAGGIFSNAVMIDEHSNQTGSTLWERFGFSTRERDRVICGDFASVLLRHPIVTGATLMFRRDLLDDVLPIPSGWIHDEWISWRIALRSTIVFTETQVMAYRTHASQQIGVPQGWVPRLLNIWNALCHGPALSTKARVRKEYLHGARELGRLTEPAPEGSVQCENFRKDIQAKIAFCEAVLCSFHRQRLLRVWFAIKNISNYRRFRYLPMYSLLRDIFV